MKYFHTFIALKITFEVNGFKGLSALSKDLSKTDNQTLGYLKKEYVATSAVYTISDNTESGFKHLLLENV